MTADIPSDLPANEDVIIVLERQHERIKELLAQVKSAQGDHRQQTFDELRTLLAAHETAEEMVLRPVSRTYAGGDVADARNAEESEANHVLADLEKLDVDSSDFEQMFARFADAVVQHATHEEQLEFPSLQALPQEQRDRMSRALLAAERLAPTHPHSGVTGSPSGQRATAPLASLLDRARDAVREAIHH